MSKEMTIEEIKKNNELFSNSLTFKIVWKSKFMQLLISGGFEKNYVEDYTRVIEKYLKDFENHLNLHLANLKK